MVNILRIKPEHTGTFMQTSHILKYSLKMSLSVSLVQIMYVMQYKQLQIVLYQVGYKNVFLIYIKCFLITKIQNIKKIITRCLRKNLKFLFFSQNL